MEVVITAAAKLDLFKIGEDIRREAPARADSFVQTLVDHCARTGGNAAAISARTTL